MITARYFLASLVKASVLGPGMVSASLKKRWSSIWQKYWEPKSSWVQMILAPSLAARSMSLVCLARLSLKEGEQAICVRPMGMIREEAFLGSFGRWDFMSLIERRIDGHV